MLIIANIVKGIYYLEDELLFHKEYDVHLKDNKIMKNIISCELKNIKDYSFYYSTRINIDITFDVLLLYEFEDCETTKRSYDIIVEKVKKTFQINANVYGASTLDITDLKLINHIKKVKYKVDTSPNQEKFIVFMSGFIDSYLAKEELISLNDFSEKHEDELIINIHDSTRLPILEQKEKEYGSDVAGSLAKAEMSLCDAMNKVVNLYNTNSDLREKLISKEKQIEYSERTIKSLKESNQELQRSFNELNMELKELKQKINNQDKVIIKLEEDLSLKEKSLKELTDENSKLKEKIQGMRDKKANRIMERFKMKMQNII
ncbi:MAG TPA: hypothetical protein GXX20_07955 [Clostridiaceae bacterium]|nr:hypothetical protein [Clostridiaceae bacterium]